MSPDISKALIGQIPLVGLAEVWMNDAFAAPHPPHPSTEGVAHLLPATVALLMERQIGALARVGENPKLPSSLSLAPRLEKHETEPRIHTEVPGEGA